MASKAFIKHTDHALRTKGVFYWVAGLVVSAVMGSGCSDGDVATAPERLTPPNVPAPAQPSRTPPATTQSGELNSAKDDSDMLSAGGSEADTTPSGDSQQAEKAAGDNPSQEDAATDKRPAEVAVDQSTGPADVAMSQKIRLAVRALRSESGKLQVVGRALSPAEQTRVQDLEQAIQHLEVSLQALAPTAGKKRSGEVAEGDPVNAEHLIDELIKSTDASIAEIQVVGRAMTDAELSRARTLLRVADGLRRAVGEIALEDTGGRPQPDLLELLPD
ncbi:MAG: hypothetical protein CMJ70_13140 [Planctomycetaceae bacterium]|nr:hypothetical protein [Planctomycetaceae bacterium]